MDRDEQNIAPRSSIGDLLFSLYSAAGVGLMVGMLLGLSISPIVASFVGAVGAGLAVLLGLNENHLTRAKSIRIGTFGFVTILGALIGIYLRTHNLLSPSLEEEKQRLLDLGYTTTEALSQLRGDSVLGNSSSEAVTGQTVLFSEELPVRQCEFISDQGVQDLTWSDFKQNFVIEGGVWATLAKTAEVLGDELAPKSTLIATRDVLCGAIVLSAADCREVIFQRDSSPNDITQLARSAPLESIRRNISEGVKPELQLSAYKVVIDSLYQECSPDER